MIFIRKNGCIKIMNQNLNLEQLIDRFGELGYVECRSPKNRRKLYRYLWKNGIQYKTEIIGYTIGSKSMCRWSGRCMGWDLGRVVKWIKAERITPDDLRKCCHKGRYKFEDIEKAFDKDVPMNEKWEIIKKGWGGLIEWDKYTPFDNCPLRKTIVRITRV